MKRIRPASSFAWLTYPFCWIAILSLRVGLPALSAQVGASRQDNFFAENPAVVGNDEGCSSASALEWEKIGQTEQSRNAHSSAAAAFERAIRCGLSQPVLWYRLGLAYSASGEHRKAVAALTRAVDGGFNNTGALYHLIESAFASRQAGLALERSRELMTVGARSPVLMLRIGRLLFTHLFYRDASKAFALAIHADPADRQARFYLGLTQHLLHESDAAIDSLKVLTANAPNAETLTLLAAVHAQKREYDVAEHLLDLASSQYRDSAHADLNRALMYLEQDQLDRAAASFSRFRRMPNASGAKVFVHISINRCQELRKSLSEPGESAAGDGTGPYFQDLAAQMSGKYQYGAAVQLLRLALQNGSQPSQLLLSAGHSCFNLDPQSGAALSLLERAASYSPQNGDTWHLLGRAYMRQSLYEKAIPALQRSVALKPTALHYMSLGRAYMASGTGTPRYEDALKMLHQAERLNADDAAVHYELARVYLQTEQFRTARGHLEKAIDIEPDFYEAYYVLGRVCMRLGEQDEARKYLALFERRRNAVKQHSVLDNGYGSEGHLR